MRQINQNRTNKVEANVGYMKLSLGQPRFDYVMFNEQYGINSRVICVPNNQKKSVYFSTLK